MVRKVAIFGAVVAGAGNAKRDPGFGDLPTGSIVANLLQLAACAMAATMACLASQRGRGLARPFWSMVALALATWGVANIGWMYYENLIHAQVPPMSVVRIHVR